jgi:hypothetical protein
MNAESLRANALSAGAASTFQKSPMVDHESGHLQLGGQDGAGTHSRRAVYVCEADLWRAGDLALARHAA